MNRAIFWVLMLGNILNEYDSSLYAFLAYRLTLEFLGNEITTSNLIKSYTILTTGMIVKPLGVIIFNKLAVQRSPAHSLNISLFGMGIATFLIGLIPAANEIGIFAPIILITARMIQGVFGAGESNISSMHLIAIVQRNKGGDASGYYNISIVLGILLASIGVNYFDGPDEWRILYIAGGTTAIVGAIARYMLLYTERKNLQSNIKTENLSEYTSSKTIIKEMMNNKALLARVVAISMFSYMTYFLTFVCVDAIVPQLNSGITHQELQVNNTILLLFDAALFFLFVWLAQYVHYRYIMLVSAFCVGTIIPTMFLWIGEMSVEMIIIYKIIIIIFGVGFCAFLNQHVFKVCENKNYYWFFGVGYTIAGAYIGNSLPSIMLLIYDKSGSLSFVSIYLSIIAFCTFFSVMTDKTQVNHNTGIK